jgi:hypothetical protein
MKLCTQKLKDHWLTLRAIYEDIFGILGVFFWLKHHLQVEDALDI